MEDELVIRRLPKSRVRVVRDWAPVHARYYDFLGIALEETEAEVIAAVYGVLPAEQKRIGVVAVRRERARPIPYA